MSNYGKNSMQKKMCYVLLSPRILLNNKVQGITLTFDHHMLEMVIASSKKISVWLTFRWLAVNIKKIICFWRGIM